LRVVAWFGLIVRHDLGSRRDIRYSLLKKFISGPL
jgi:hypothetical protein